MNDYVKTIQAMRNLTEDQIKDAVVYYAAHYPKEFVTLTSTENQCYMYEGEQLKNCSGTKWLAKAILCLANCTFAMKQSVCYKLASRHPKGFLKAIGKDFDFLVPNENTPRCLIGDDRLRAECEGLVVNLLKQGFRIKAIKQIKEKTNIPLLEARDYVDSFPYKKAVGYDS